MKKILLPLSAIVLLLSFSKITFELKSSATVNQVQGVYIFTDSKPIGLYDYLGTVSTAGIVWKTRGYEESRETLLKKLKKEYPQAEGAIFSFTDNKGKADAIKFK